MERPSSAQISDVSLRVRNLDGAADFYRSALGFKDLASRSGEKRMSASGNEPAQILLVEDQQAAPRRLSAPGLFHTAFLFPSRHSLSTALHHLVENEVRIHGFADHGVSEAIYLADPEGNGIELYRDRPKESWVNENGDIVMVTDPLDLEGLMREAKSEGGSTYVLDPATVIGHIHLQVSNLRSAEIFYHQLLGFDITQRSYPGALFMSAGGYHHHVGLNVWNSKNGRPAPGTAGLISFGIDIPDSGAYEAVVARMLNHGLEVDRASTNQTIVSDLDGIAVHLNHFNHHHFSEGITS